MQIRIFNHRKMLLNKIKTELFCCVAAGLLLSSCGGKEFVYHENIPVKGEIWRMENPLSFQFPITDTATVYLVGLNVRYTLNYPMQNLYVFLHTTFPNNMQTSDTISVNLFSKDGTPFGSGNRIKELDVPIAKIRFPQRGQYHIQMEQGMRKNELEGVVSMGFYVLKKSGAEN